VTLSDLVDRCAASHGTGARGAARVWIFGPHPDRVHTIEIIGPRNVDHAACGALLAGSISAAAPLLPWAPTALVVALLDGARLVVDGASSGEALARISPACAPHAAEPVRLPPARSIAAVLLRHAQRLWAAPLN